MYVHIHSVGARGEWPGHCGQARSNDPADLRGLNRDPDVIPLRLGPKGRVHFVPCDCSLKFPFSVNPNRLPNTHLPLLRQHRDTLIIAVIVIILHMLLNPVELTPMLPRHGQSSGHHIIILSCSRLKLRLSRTFGGSKS